MAGGFDIRYLREVFNPNSRFFVIAEESGRLAHKPRCRIDTQSQKNYSNSKTFSR